MSVTPKILSKRAIRVTEIEAMVRDQCRIIEDQITDMQVRWGQNVATFSMPDVMSFPGLDKRDAQTVVYHGILKHFEKLGFDIELRATDRKTIMILRWKTGLDAEELEDMRDYIIKFVQKPTQLERKQGVNGLENGLSDM